MKKHRTFSGKSRGLEQNLELLTAQHRNTGRALKGYKHTVTYIRKETQSELDWALRYHVPNGVYEMEEVDYRDQVDFLLKYYSLVEVGIITGALPSKLNDKLKSEILYILQNDAVRSYYESRYPLLLPSLLVYFASHSEHQPVTSGHSYFNELLLIDSLIDDDVEVFLWFLDSGKMDGYSLRDLLKLLESKNKIKQLMGRVKGDEDALDQGFWGFIKFADYMERYAMLLMKCQDEFVRSVLWHYQSYWFMNMKVLIEDKYIAAIKRLKALCSSITFKEYVRERTKDELHAKENVKKLLIDYEMWLHESDRRLEDSLNFMHYNLDSRHGVPLIEFAKGRVVSNNILFPARKERLLKHKSKESSSRKDRRRRPRH